MAKRVTYMLLLLWLLWGMGRVTAQVKLDYKTVRGHADSLYAQGEWNALLKYGDEALEEGISYKDLQYQLGVAAYKLRRWKLSVQQLDSCLGFYAKDGAALNYMHWAYGISGRAVEAVKARERFTGVNMSWLDFGAGFQEAYLEAGYKLSGDPELVENFPWFQVALKERLSPRLTLNQAYTYSQFGNSEFTFNSHAFYLGGDLELFKGWHLYSGLQYNESTSPLAVPPPPPPGDPADTIIDAEQRVMALGAGLGKVFRGHHIMPYFSAGWYRFYLFPPPPDSTNPAATAETMQLGLRWRYTLPIQNYGAWVAVDASGHLADGEWTPILKATASMRLYKSWRLLASYYTGGVENVVEDLAYFVNNSPAILDHRITAQTSLGIGRRLNLFLTYQHEIRADSDGGETIRFNNFVAGLKFNF